MQLKQCQTEGTGCPQLLFLAYTAVSPKASRHPHVTIRTLAATFRNRAWTEVAISGASASVVRLETGAVRRNTSVLYPTLTSTQTLDSMLSRGVCNYSIRTDGFGPRSGSHLVRASLPPSESGTALTPFRPARPLASTMSSSSTSRHGSSS